MKNASVCKISKLSETIKSLSTTEVTSEDELKDIVKLIEDNKVFQTDLSHKRNIKKIKKDNLQKIKQNICPKCGGSLVERTGKYGKFSGCENFPKCRFTINNAK